MSENLFNFFYNTVRKRANDPVNKRFFLPDVLRAAEDGAEGKLLPQRGNNWDFGEVTGEGGQTIRNTIVQAWWALAEKQVRKAKPDLPFREFMAIATPSAPWPLLRMPSVTVDGLFNVWLAPTPLVTEPGNGYRVTVTVQFGHYDGSDGGPAFPQVRLSGRYELLQAVCAARKVAPTRCVDDVPLTLAHMQWPIEQIDGTGAVEVELTDAFVEADLEISVGPRRTLEVAVERLTLRGPAPDQPPTISMARDALTIDSGVSETMVDAWELSLVNAFSQPVTHRAITENLNELLNHPDNRARLAGLLRTQLASLLDDVLGAAPALPSKAGQGARNPVDQYLFDRMRVSLQNPASTYYLPKVVAASHDPVLEPLLVDEISLGDLKVGLGMPTLSDVRLTGVTVMGLSNISAPPELLVHHGDTIEGTLALSTLDPPPRVTITRGGVRTGVDVPRKPLKVAGQFSIASPEGDGSRLGGEFSLEVDHSSVAAAIRLSGTDLESLRIDFTALSLNAAPADCRVALKIDSMFSDIVEDALNQDEVKARMLDAIKQHAAGALASVSDSATADVRRIVAAELGGG